MLRVSASASEDTEVMGVAYFWGGGWGNRASPWLKRAFHNSSSWASSSRDPLRVAADDPLAALHLLGHWPRSLQHGVVLLHRRKGHPVPGREHGNRRLLPRRRGLCGHPARARGRDLGAPWSSIPEASEGRWNHTITALAHWLRLS